MGWGKFNSELNEKRRTQLAKQVENSFEKDTRINIRISRRDLEERVGVVFIDWQVA